MHNNRQAHGYESLMLIIALVVVALVIASAFIPAVTLGHVDIFDGIRRLFEKLSSTT